MLSQFPQTNNHADGVIDKKDGHLYMNILVTYIYISKMLQSTRPTKGLTLQ